MEFLNSDNAFPDVTKASEDGLLAVGGDLSANRLLTAYQKGIFPWFEDDNTILWWSPDPRFVLFPKDLKVSKSMKQVIRNTDFVVTVNKDFNAVIAACSAAKRPGQDDTWITNGMIEDNTLVGGLYGVDLGNGVFCGESMFTKVSNASKVGFISFIQNTNYKLIDCQVYTNHLESLGAIDISRDQFLKYLT